MRHRFGGKGSADLATSSHPFHFIMTLKSQRRQHYFLLNPSASASTAPSRTLYFTIRCMSSGSNSNSPQISFSAMVHHVMTVPVRLKRRGHTPILFWTLKMLRLPIIDTSAFEDSLCLRTSFLPSSDQNTVSVPSWRSNPYKPAASQHYHLVFK